ncbi:phage tail protein [Streptomyces sp. NPDC050095]|uniref:phage tail protein n=1 Tax=unclassified Streptomyces TaxID=2593676 RepID=UPI00341DE619
MGAFDGALSASRYSLTTDGVEIASFGQLGELRSAEIVLDAAGKPVAGAPRPRVVLLRGWSAATELWSWHQAAVSGSPAGRRSCTLVGYGSDGKPVAKYWLEKAFPVRLDMGPVTGTSPQQLAETLTLSCDTLQRLAP